MRTLFGLILYSPHMVSTSSFISTSHSIDFFSLKKIAILFKIYLTAPIMIASTHNIKIIFDIRSKAGVRINKTPCHMPNFFSTTINEIYATGSIQNIVVTFNNVYTILRKPAFSSSLPNKYHMIDITPPVMDVRQIQYCILTIDSIQ